MEFIYSKQQMPGGILLEQVGGCAGDHSDKVWLAMARQIWAENDPDGNYRDVGHFDNGIPFLYGDNHRLSISHTKDMFVAATRKMSDSDLASLYAPDSAVGVDSERLDRKQAMKCKDRFLSDRELTYIDSLPEDIRLRYCVLAWTIKEAMYKAALTSVADIREDIRIETWPEIAGKKQVPGKGYVIAAGTERWFTLCARCDGNYIITLAY